MQARREETVVTKESLAPRDSERKILIERELSSEKICERLKTSLADAEEDVRAFVRRPENLRALMDIAHIVCESPEWFSSRVHGMIRAEAVEIEDGYFNHVVTIRFDEYGAGEVQGSQADILWYAADPSRLSCLDMVHQKARILEAMRICEPLGMITLMSPTPSGTCFSDFN